MSTSWTLPSAFSLRNISKGSVEVPGKDCLHFRTSDQYFSGNSFPINSSYCLPADVLRFALTAASAASSCFLSAAEHIEAMDRKTVSVAMIALEFNWLLLSVCMAKVFVSAQTAEVFCN